MKRHLFILTGGSRGMGAAMARQLLTEGHALVCISRTSDPQLQTVADAQHASLEQWHCDLGSPQAAAQQVHAWISARSDSMFSSATLINNAGVIPPIAPLAASNWQAVSQALHVGLEAPMLLTAAFLHSTQSWRIPRKVLNVSSGLGRRAMASQAPYCAVKAGLDNFSRCVALDEAASPNPAKICALAPGVVDTDMQVQLRSADPQQFPDVARFQQLKADNTLSSAQDAAAAVLAWLQRPDFGDPVIADVRHA